MLSCEYLLQKTSHESQDDDLDDAKFLPDYDEQIKDEEDNISPALRALMKK